METPSSIRKAAVSHNSAGSRTNGNADRSALHDITNDSPIVGLATEKLTPASSASVNRGGPMKKTPGSGEALLRGQVKNLLQKVEEEIGVTGKFPSGGNGIIHRPPFPAAVGFFLSPSQLAAPTPANTPATGDPVGVIVVAPAVQQQDPKVPAAQLNVSVEGKQQPEVSPEEPLDCSISRALTFDSPHKLECWNHSAAAGEAEEEEEEEQEKEEGAVGDLCQQLMKMTLFTGKHTRFLYNSDDEIDGVEEVAVKHLRFHGDEGEEEEKKN